MGDPQPQATADEATRSTLPQAGRGGGGEPGDAHELVEAYRAARSLLAAAEEDRAAILADAERRARVREQEAELLVAKARRLLEAAEQKAAVILAQARPAPELLDLTDPALGRVVAPRATLLPRGSLAARIDEIVASAVAHAVDEALPASRSLDAAS